VEYHVNEALHPSAPHHLPGFITAPVVTSNPFGANGKRFLSREMLDDMRDRGREASPLREARVSAFGPHVGAALGDELQIGIGLKG
jgi:hypothetical protein